MELLQLRQFKTLAEVEHMTKAASILHISQPTLSLTIRRLEDDIGVPLFDRVGRSIHLNQYGKLFLEYVTPSLDQLDKGIQAISQLKSDLENKVILIAPSMQSFPNLLERILDVCPNLSFIKGTSSSDDIVQALKKNRASLGIINGNPEYPGLNSAFLYSNELFLVMSPSHPLACYDSIDLIDLKDASFASYAKDTMPRNLLEHFCGLAGFSPHVRFEAPSLQEVLTAVQLGNYVAMISEAAFCHGSIETLKKVRITNPSCSITQYVVWFDDAQLTPIVKAVRRIIVDYFSTRNETL